MNWSFIQKTLSKAESENNFISNNKMLKEKLIFFGADIKIGSSHYFIQSRKGSGMVVCVLLLGLFLTLGVSLMLSSQLFLQVQGFRKLSTISSYAAENGIKEALEKTEARAEEVYSGAEINEEMFLKLKQQLEAGQLDLIEPLLAEAVLSRTDEFSGMKWQTAATGRLSSLLSLEQYLKAAFEFNIKSTGQVQGFSGKRSKELVLGLTIYAGHLPLNQLPLAVEDGGLKETEKSQIKIIQNKANLSQSRPLSLNDTFIPDEALPLISRGLKIFRPDRLPNWLLRQALGLEDNNEQVPDGVYLVRDDLGLGGVYVQGDLDELVLGIENDSQLIQFRQADELWLLKFNPAKGETFFITSKNQESFDSLPLSIIMVNGEIESLAAGNINPDGYLVAIEDKQSPALLNGLRLTIVCSRKINLTSDLILQGVEWKDGIPYVKSKQSQLIIWSTGKDFQSEELVDGGISLLGGINKDRIIAANLIAGSQGLQISSTSAEVKIVGSLAATNIELGQNRLAVFHQPENQPDAIDQTDLQVYSTKPLIHLSEFKVMEWRPSR
jgi:hypothetical protein